MPLCVALKRAMRLQGLSLDAASRMIGAKNVYVMKWMSGQTVPGWAMHSKIHRALGIFAHAEIDSLITREERLAAGRGEIPDFSALTIKRVRWEMPECVRAGQQKYWEMRRKQLEEAEDAEQSSD
jgi:transcriptional regulator with XRE-family HTH domain